MEKLYYILPLLLLTPTSGMPVKYDQRQEGELNVHAHLENFVIVLVPSVSLADFLPFKKMNTLLAKPGEQKFVPQGTGTKVSAPDFPAGKSPYKVDIDKSDGDETGVKEVLIAHVPSALIINSQVKSEGELDETTTLTSSYEESTTKLVEIVLPATEKVENDVSSVNSDKKENTAQKNQIKEEEKTEVKEENKQDQKTGVEEEKKEDQKTDIKDDLKPVNDEKKKGEDVKIDEAPVIGTVPAKPSKAPKSIDFGIEAAKSRLQSVSEDESSHVIYSRVKNFKVPTHRQEVVMDPPVGSEEYARRLKMLRTGLEGCEPGEVMTDSGECLPAKFKQRSGNYFSSGSEDRLLPILQFGLSAANPDESY